jgi:hypothetical protein
MSVTAVFLTICLLFTGFCLLHPESFRTIIESSIDVTPERPAGTTVTAGINSSIIISLGAEARFLRGIEVEISCPQAWLSYRGSLGMAVYNNFNAQISSGIADITGSRIGFEPLPSRLQIIYQIPVRQAHGLRTTTSVTVPTGITLPSTFPVLFRIMPVIKGLSDELENMMFNVTVRPIVSDEGAIRLIPRFPPRLAGRPFTVMINDNVITNISEQIVLREGEHHLVILSDDYRNESRRFIVERTKVVDLIIDLQDPTPVFIFEGPQNAQIYIDNVRVPRNRESMTVEPGPREIRFVVGDYTVTRTLNVQRGKTYRIALNVDLTIQEDD